MTDEEQKSNILTAKLLRLVKNSTYGVTNICERCGLSELCQDYSNDCRAVRRELMKNEKE